MKKNFATLGFCVFMTSPSVEAMEMTLELLHPRNIELLNQHIEVFKKYPGKLDYPTRRLASIGLAVKMALNKSPIRSPGNHAIVFVDVIKYLTGFNILGEVSPYYRLGPSGFSLGLNPEMQTNPQTYHKLSVSYDNNPVAIHVDQKYQVLNGLTGTLRDILLRLLSMTNSDSDIRNIIGMNTNHYLWKKHPSFVNRNHIPLTYLTYKYRNIILTCLEKRGNKLGVIVDETTKYMLGQLTLHEMCLYFLSEGERLFSGGLGAVVSRVNTPRFVPCGGLSAHELFRSCTPKDTLMVIKPLEDKLLEWRNFSDSFLAHANHTNEAPVCFRIIEVFIDAKDVPPESGVEYLLSEISASTGTKERARALLRAMVPLDHHRYLAGSYPEPFLGCLTATDFAPNDLREPDPDKLKIKQEILVAAGAKDKETLDKEKELLDEEKRTEMHEKTKK